MPTPSALAIPLEHERRPADARGRTGADRRRQAAMALRDGRSVVNTIADAARNTTTDRSAPTPSTLATAARPAPAAKGAK